MKKIIIFLIIALIILAAVFVIKDFTIDKQTPQSPTNNEVIDYSKCEHNYEVKCVGFDGVGDAIYSPISCSTNNDCTINKMKKECANDEFVSSEDNIGVVYYCGDNGFCRGAECSTEIIN